VRHRAGVPATESIIQLGEHVDGGPEALHVADPDPHPTRHLVAAGRTGSRGDQPAQ
jgi:hypothetical protein